MRISVLGSLDAELKGIPILPTAAKPRQILALLAIYANQVLPVSALMQEIWGDAPPRSALTTLQTYILQLGAAWRRRWTESPAAPRNCC